MQVLDGEKQLKSQISDASPQRGKRTISSPGGVGTLIYPWLLDMQQQWPELNIHFTFNPTRDVELEVKQGNCDIGFITHMTNDAELEVELLAEEHLCLILPKGFNYKNFRQLDDRGFIDHPDGKLVASEVLPQMFKGEDINIENLKTSGYINHVGMICDPVARGFGYTVLHEYIVQLSPVFEQLMVVTPEQQLSHRVSVIYKKRWPLHPRYREVINILKDRLSEFSQLQESYF